MRKLSILLSAVCMVACLFCMPITAYAGVSDDYIEETVATEPVIVPGEGFKDDGNLVTRDLLYDEHTNKQFISVQTSGGNTFYMVIDYDKPVDEDAEQYQTYFFSIVDEADLLAALEAAGMELPACGCMERCVAGAVNTACSVCAVNMGDCVGVAPETEPAETEPAPEPKPKSNHAGVYLLVILAAGGGGAVLYFKYFRSEQQSTGVTEDYGDELDGYDDNPPWDEDTEEDAE